MKIKEFIDYAKINNIRLTSSEEFEKTEINEFYEELRNYFYRVFETYYKDEYQCVQFYCTGFVNEEKGYEYLLSTNEDLDNVDLDKAQFDLYVELEGSDKYERKDEQIFTGTLSEIATFTKNLDKQNVAKYHRWS